MSLPLQGFRTLPDRSRNRFGAEASCGI